MDTVEKRFIIRERVRKKLIKTEPYETVCLQYWEVELILKWIKELERTVAEYGNTKHKTQYCKGPLDRNGSR